MQLVPNQRNTSGFCDDGHMLKLSEMCCLLQSWYFLMPSFLLCQCTYSLCHMSSLCTALEQNGDSLYSKFGALKILLKAAKINAHCVTLELRFNENLDRPFRCRQRFNFLSLLNEAWENYLCLIVFFSAFENLPKLTYSYIVLEKESPLLPPCSPLHSLLDFFKIIFRKGLLDKTKSNTEAENNCYLSSSKLH